MLAYEYIRWTSDHLDHPIIMILTSPGMALKNLTTNEPYEKPHEVSLATFNAMYALEIKKEIMFIKFGYIGEELNTPSKNILILMALKFPFRELLLIIFGILIGGLFFLMSSPPKGNPITLLPSPTQVPIKVYIRGAKKNPGTYELEKDSRLSD